MPFCVMPFCVLPLYVVPFCVLPFCVMPLCVMPYCVLPFCVMPLCVMPFRVLPLCVMPPCVLPFSVMPFSKWYLYDGGFFSISSFYRGLFFTNFDSAYFRIDLTFFNFRLLNFVIDIPSYTLYGMEWNDLFNVLLAQSSKPELKTSKTLDKLKIQDKIKCELCIYKYKKPNY